MLVSTSFHLSPVPLLLHMITSITVSQSGKSIFFHVTIYIGECMAQWGEPDVIINIRILACKVHIISSNTVQYYINVTPACTHTKATVQGMELKVNTKGLAFIQDMFTQTHNEPIPYIGKFSRMAHFEVFANKLSRITILFKLFTTNEAENVLKILRL